MPSALRSLDEMVPTSASKTRIRPNLLSARAVDGNVVRGKVVAFATNRRMIEARDAASKTLSESAVLQFRANDRRIVTNELIR